MQARVGVAIVAVLAVQLLLAVETSAVTCSRFTTCGDCVCQVDGYTVGQTCSKSPSCSWCSSTGTCGAASENNTCENSIASFRDPGYDDDDNISKFLCPDQANVATVIVSCSMYFLAAVFMIIAIVQYCKAKRRAAKPRDAAWLQTVARSYLPPKDVVQWEGVSTGTPLNQSLCSLVAFQLFLDLPFLGPVTIWLLIGLPSIYSSDDFGFFFPVCFIGGLGLFLNSAIWILYEDNPSSAYILADKHTVIATGHCHTRVQKAVTVSNAPSKASNIVIRGTSVSFNCGGGTVTFANLDDTSTLESHLCQRQDDGGSLADSVLPAGAGAASVLVGTASGYSPSVPVSTASGYSAVPDVTFETDKAAPPPDSSSATIL